MTPGRIPIADYDEERRLFRGLLAAGCRRRILLLRGEGGTGKTSLLRACQEELAAGREDVFHCAVELRATAVSLAEIFSRMSRCVGWGRLPGLERHLAASRGAGSVTISDTRLLGKDQMINVALHAADPETRSQRLTAMTDALFADLASLPKPMLLVMDTFEKAAEEVSDWIAGPFLERVAATEPMRVLLAGRRIPDAGIEWGACCDTRELFGVKEAGHWLPVVEAMERVVPVEPPETWLAGVCHALDGPPGKIMKVIEQLPRRGVGA